MGSPGEASGRMEEIERSAASVEEAIETALEELGLSEQEVQVEIVQEPRSGFLGLNPQPAVVKVRARGPVHEDLAPSPDQAEAGKTFVAGLLSAMGMDVEVEVSDAGGVTYLDVWAGDSAEDMGLLIGRRGHTLEAVQELLRGHIRHSLGGRCLVQVDVEDYRKRRRSQITSRAREAARQAKKSGRDQALEPMSAFERKLVHDTVAEIPGLQTSSEGEEPGRYVVIRNVSA